MSAPAADTIGGGGRRPAPSRVGEPVVVRVRGRFEPETIVAPLGEPLLLELRRETSSVCADRFLFAAFGIDLPLPLGEPVTVDLHPRKPGEYPFGCRFGTLRGRLIVR